MVAALDPFNPTSNTYGTRDRVFNFGAIIAQLGGDAGTDSAAAAAAEAPATKASGKHSSKRNSEAVAAGAVVDPAAVAADFEVGQKANLKIINPKKVPCTVVFTIKPRGSYPPGA